MNRRKFMMSASIGALATAAGASTAFAKKMMSPLKWTDQHGLTNNMKKDPNPLENELEKYPRCPYCGMARKMWSHSRHLIQYDDDSVEGTCSIHCTAISLSLNMDRGPKHIWVGDAGSDAKIKPLVEVDKANYALESGKMGTMTSNRKWAFADAAKAKATGGKVVGFDEALQVAFADMGKDTLLIRKRRGEKRAHMAKKMKMMKAK